MRIREVMIERGVSAQQLADILGISVSALNQHIGGNPSVRIVERIANAIGVPMWYLFASPDEVLSDISQGGSPVATARVRRGLSLLVRKRKQGGM